MSNLVHILPNLVINNVQGLRVHSSAILGEGTAVVDDIERAQRCLCCSMLTPSDREQHQCNLPSSSHFSSSFSSSSHLNQFSPVTTHRRRLPPRFSTSLHRCPRAWAAVSTEVVSLHQSTTVSTEVVGEHEEGLALWLHSWGFLPKEQGWHQSYSICTCGTAESIVAIGYDHDNEWLFIGTIVLVGTFGVSLFDMRYDLSNRTSVEVPTVLLRFTGGSELWLAEKRLRDGLAVDGIGQDGHKKRLRTFLIWSHMSSASIKYDNMKMNAPVMEEDIMDVVANSA
ncbi:hypothetical protein [Oryza sativa Japonica Group]|uniref:Uncharacterized protein n=1 Tax=Oryza sativa subsp. japonica TaxID=39947 RepID=Q5QLX9_ORYSJ|nr:hypothetical protein [Oryza sativa Japonica Group]